MDETCTLRQEVTSGGWDLTEFARRDPDDLRAIHAQSWDT